MKKIAILGSTGSIGTQTLDIIRKNPDIKVTALAALKNTNLLIEQIKEFEPEIVCVYDDERACLLRDRLKAESVPYGIKKIPEITSGMDGLIEAAVYNETDTVVTSVVGMIGIRPTIAAIKAKKNIALANKETLVCAGHIIMPLANKEGVKILPVDSEHSAIFQSLQGANGNKIRKLILTASGGPFLNKPIEEFENITVEEALKHPNWDMGAKVTIDSSTMVNKGLEVCEAKWLFDVSVKDIEVVIQPQSILHSAVEFEDGSVIAELGTADMRLPISYAINYPERRFVSERYLNLFEVARLDFIKPDLKKFKGLKLAMDAMEEGGSFPAVFNAADEAAVSLFIGGKIGYTEIVGIIEKELDGHKKISSPDVHEIEAIQAEILKKTGAV